MPQGGNFSGKRPRSRESGKFHKLRKIFGLSMNLLCERIHPPPFHTILTYFSHSGQPAHGFARGPPHYMNTATDTRLMKGFFACNQFAHPALGDSIVTRASSFFPAAILLISFPESKKRARPFVPSGTKPIRRVRRNPPAPFPSVSRGRNRPSNCRGPANAAGNIPWEGRSAENRKEK